MGFDQDLTRVAQDPATRRLAERRAGTRELAEDAPQETYCAVERAKNPETMRDLRAFFRLWSIRSTISARAQPPFPSLDDHGPARACLLNG
jgi:DNA-directed RNA polymerase specialized sigma24 family protein